MLFFFLVKKSHACVISAAERPLQPGILLTEFKNQCIARVNLALLVLAGWSGGSGAAPAQRVALEPLVLPQQEKRFSCHVFRIFLLFFFYF